MSRPVLLDLFGCEGVGAQGYERAGFTVWSVDNARARLRYNPYAFHLGDWREGLDRALATGRVAVIHASAPCQRFTRGNAPRREGDRTGHVDLITPAREALEATGLPYVLENVEDAARAGAIRADLTLCGSQFGLTAVDDDGTPLRMERHRVFESNVPLALPGGCGCRHNKSVRVAGSYGGARRDKDEARFVRKGGYVPSREVQRALLGAPPWATERGLYECLPPVYTEWCGLQLRQHLLAGQVAA